MHSEIEIVYSQRIGCQVEYVKVRYCNELIMRRYLLKFEDSSSLAINFSFCSIGVADDFNSMHLQLMSIAKVLLLR